MPVTIDKNDRKRIQDYAKLCAEMDMHATLNVKPDCGRWFVHGRNDKILAIVDAKSYDEAFRAVVRIRDKVTAAVELRKFAARVRSPKS